MLYHVYQFYNQHFFFFLICNNGDHNRRVDVTRKLLFGRLISRLTVSRVRKHGKCCITSVNGLSVITLQLKKDVKSHLLFISPWLEALSGFRQLLVNRSMLQGEHLVSSEQSHLPFTTMRTRQKRPTTTQDTSC